MKNEHRQAEHEVQQVLALEHHRRALEQAELVVARQLAEGDHRAAEGDRADRRAEDELEPVAGRDRATAPSPRATMPNAYGSTTAATAMNTAARPIMLWKNATSSGILVISTVLARQAP